MDREEVHRKEKEALARELVQLRAQLAQLTVAYNAMHAELGKVTSECETLRLMVTKFRDGAALQEKQANERVARVEEK
eukprot:982448-Lingulodinium_polyedra.AAC.1